MLCVVNGDCECMVCVGMGDGVCVFVGWGVSGDYGQFLRVVCAAVSVYVGWVAGMDYG